MFKKIIIWIGLAVLLLLHPVAAEQKVKVAIFPLKTISDNPQVQVAGKIEAMIAEKLELEGAQVIFAKATTPAVSWDYAQFREQGIKLGVDYILTGTLFVAGQGLSIDATLVDVYQPSNTQVFYTHADSSEQLFSAVSKISKETIGQVFQKVIISDIDISGNRRIEADAILRIINTQPGDIVRPENITKDLRNIYKMGYFDDVIADQQLLDKGVKIVFKVVEKPTVRKIRFEKNMVFEDEELADFVDTRTGSILNLHKINSDLKRIRLMYTEKNYHNCKISYEVKALENSQADIVFTIQEGNKLRVEKITFEGNDYFSDRKLKKEIETNEKGFFSLFTSSGDLNETEVKNDVIRIESLYKNNGFVDTKVSDPIIDIGSEYISIHFKIAEGNQYLVKSVDILGDLIVPKAEILDLVQLKESKLYNREKIREDIIEMTDFYSDRGYANVVIKPLIEKDDEQKQVSIGYTIDKKNPVYFRRINIQGNYRTRDKVIRREVKIEEQGIYSKTNIQKTFKNLNRLDYFESIDVKPVKTENDDELDLDVTVKEKQTGQFSFGGGYSSEEAAFFMLQLAERNLFGKGQTGKIGFKMSKDSILYNIGFFEPYILDTPISGGVDLYREEKEYDYYDKDATGFSGTLGYKLYDYTRIGIRYNIEDFEISDVQSTHTSMTPGSFLLSSLKPFITYDSRDDLFMPTEGMRHSFSIEYAGEFLGSDIDYTKYLVESSVFFPLFWKLTMGVHAEGGYLDDRSSDTIDIDYARFYLGGIKSIRGFDSTDINGTRNGDTLERGGEKYVQFNAEVTFPFTEKYKMVGVLFYDRGDVYRTSEEIDLGDQFSSFGIGVRWNSPVGPLRMEYGWVIDGKEIKSSGDGQFEFSVGASF